MPLLNLGNAASFLWSPVADPNPNPNQAELYQSLTPALTLTLALTRLSSSSRCWRMRCNRWPTRRCVRGSAQRRVSWQGLSLSFSGYDQRLPELAELVGDALRTFSIEQLAFERQRDGLRRRLRQPVDLCSYRRNLALQTPRYTNAQFAAKIEKATLPQVRGLQARLLPEVELEPSVAGNVAAGQATALVANGCRPRWATSRFRCRCQPKKTSVATRFFFQIRDISLILSLSVFWGVKVMVRSVLFNPPKLFAK